MSELRDVHERRVVVDSLGRRRRSPVHDLRRVPQRRGTPRRFPDRDGGDLLMLPFVYRPRPGEEICVSRDAGDPVLSVCAGTHGFVAGVRVPAEETPAIARMIAEAMCEAAGLPAPVILDRPADLAPVSVPSGVVAGIEDGTILLSVVPGRSAPLRPGDARHLAAALAHFADHVESEPDPADVEALAEAISAGMAHCGGGPEGVCRVAAVTALRWMKRRKGQP